MKYSDWMFILFWLGWFLATTDISFSFLVGEKNQIVIEKTDKEKPEKKEESTEMPKSTW